MDPPLPLGAASLASARHHSHALLIELGAGPVAVGSISAGIASVVSGLAWLAGASDLPGAIPLWLAFACASQAACAVWARTSPQVGGQVSAGMWLLTNIALIYVSPVSITFTMGAFGVMVSAVIGTISGPPGRWAWGPIAVVSWWIALVLRGVPAEGAPALAGFPTVIVIGTTLLLARITARLHDSERGLHDAMYAVVSQSEQASRANQAKSDFLTSMSHELRTPLNAIIGYADLILESEPECEPVRDDVERINRAGRHLLGLVNDVLDMAKIEAGRMAFEPAPFDPHAMLRDLHSVTDSLATSRSNTLVWEVRDTLPHSVEGDELRVRQVLLNLLGNACKFTEAGEVSLHAQAAPGGWTIAVRDTGPGIDEATQSTLFQPFTQGVTGGMRAQGTGLGLAISRELVTRMGGTLSFTSRPGAGSTFEVWLPL